MLASHSDGLTRVFFLEDRLVSVGWSGDVLIDSTSRAQCDSAILDAVGAGNQIVAGCLDNSLRLVSPETGTCTTFGKADGAVKAVVTADEHTVYTGTWGKQLAAWDLRSGSNASPSDFVDVPQKIFSMDVHDNTLLVAMANRLIYLYDRRDLSKPLQVINNDMHL